MARFFDVLLHDRTIGVLRESDNGHVAFEFADAYKRDRQRDTLGQAFLDRLGASFKGKQRELPPFFANLVPEGELRPVLERELGLEPGDDLALLAVVGRDLPGAVEVRPRPGAPIPVDAPTPARAEVVQPRALTSPDEELRFSLAGVQMKFSVVRADQSITLPVSGGRGD